MEITLMRLANSIPALEELNETKIPARVALKLHKITKNVREELASLEAGRKKLVDEYGEKDGNGEVKVKDNNYVLTDSDAYTKEYIELLNTEVKFTVDKIKVADLGDVPVKTNTLLALDWLLED